MLGKVSGVGDREGLMGGVVLGLEELEALVDDLQTALDEFEDAVPVRKELQEAVARPDGRGGLRSKVGDFEDCWNNTRGDLKDGISKVRDHLQAVVDGFRGLDQEMTAQFEDSGPVQGSPVPVE
ncbi:MAG: hypothetical protein LBU50_04330 [Cellulomonas sp.]|nr:hypothetical protein [Cellulomonas sp.]